MTKSLPISIILPAKNEAFSIGSVLNKLKQLYPEAEIIVINDGSTDDTKDIALQQGAKVISHPYCQGNGASIKTGARHATSEVLVFMDADGQHKPEEISLLLNKLAKGYDMVVGARHNKTQASIVRKIGNYMYNHFASIMTGHKIEDLTSGFRAVKARQFRKFLYLLPNGFSYPTTSTMAFFRSGFPVAYVPTHAGKRRGPSHIKILRDGFRFFIIILKIGTLFSPMRLFLPVSGSVFITGISYYAYTYFNFARFTNMSALLILSSLIIFLIGIVSEQISALHYKQTDSDN